MAAELPLKIRVDIRDLWDSPKSDVQAAVGSLEETLGHRIEPFVSWPNLWNDLKDRYPDKATFIPSIARVVTAWYERLLWRLDSDNFPEWTEELLGLLVQGRKQLLIEISQPPHNRPKTTWNKKTASFSLTIPKIEPLAHSKVVAAFDTDFENLLKEDSAAAVAEEGWDDVTADPMQAMLSAATSHGAVPEPRRAVTTHTTSDISFERPPVGRLPSLPELPRPSDLFTQRAPYILTLEVGNPLVIRCSHEPTLDLISSYLTRWEKLNTNDSLRRSIFKVEIHESGFCNGLNDMLTIEPTINYRSGNYTVNPTIVLAFIEGVLGYKLIHTNGHNWSYRSETILK